MTLKKNNKYRNCTIRKKNKKHLAAVESPYFVRELVPIWSLILLEIGPYLVPNRDFFA